jgi:hypothetical protein
MFFADAALRDRELPEAPQLLVLGALGGRARMAGGGVKRRGVRGWKPVIGASVDRVLVA